MCGPPWDDYGSRLSHWVNVGIFRTQSLAGIGRLHNHSAPRRGGGRKQRTGPAVRSASLLERRRFELAVSFCIFYSCEAFEIRLFLVSEKLLCRFLSITRVEIPCDTSVCPKLDGPQRGPAVRISSAPATRVQTTVRVASDSPALVIPAKKHAAATYFPMRRETRLLVG